MNNKKNLVAYCGLFCEDCPNHKGKIADFARDLRKELRDARFDKTASFLKFLILLWKIMRKT